MFIRPDETALTTTAAERFTARRMAELEEMGAGSNPLYAVLNCTCRRGGLGYAAFSGGAYENPVPTHMMPEALANFMRSQPYAWRTIREWAENEGEVTFLGKQMTSKDAARAWLGWLIPDYDGLMRMLHASYVTKEAPSQITCVYEDRMGNFRERSLSVTKFMQNLNRKHGFRFGESYIQETSEWFGNNLGQPKYDFEIIEDYIKDVYDEAYLGSCMYEKQATEFYDRQHNVRLLRISRDGAYVGRALIWSGVEVLEGGDWHEGHTFLDRIYPSSGYHVEAAIEYAKEQGWHHKTRQAISGTNSISNPMRVPINDCNRYPYMDTFQYGAADPSYLYSNETACYNETQDYYNWYNTDGSCPWGDNDEDYYDDDDYDDYEEYEADEAEDDEDIRAEGTEASPAPSLLPITGCYCAACQEARNQ